MFMWWPFWPLAAGFMVVLVWVLVRTVRMFESTPPPPSPSRGESADEILKRRYAQGELDRDTFQRMLTDLHAV
jgi:putative membrane protein